MLYSLPSREIIADSVEYMANAHCIDALVCISNCDKITPGMLMAAMRLNIPTVFVSGGPMEAGRFGDRDVDLIDACVVSMPAGSEGDLLPVGVGVVGAYSADASRPGMTSVKVSPVGADTTAAQLYGVTVRNQQCRTDGNNVSGWGDGDVCNVMRTARVGGRIWVTAGNAATANTAAHLVVKDTTSHGLPVGSFVGTEITGDTVALTNVQWVTAASAGSLGLLEII